MATPIPTTNAEYDFLTTVTTWGNLGEIDINLFTDKDGQPTPNPQWIKSNNFITRDFRLGNLNPKIDDIQYLEDRGRLCNVLQVLRPGKFDDCVAVAISQVAVPLELSQSRLGFFRRVARTFSTSSDISEKQTVGKSFFGGSKNRGGLY